MATENYFTAIFQAIIELLEEVSPGVQGVDGQPLPQRHPRQERLPSHDLEVGDLLGRVIE